MNPVFRFAPYGLQNGVPIKPFESSETEQADLRGGRSPWFGRIEQRSRTAITENLKCDALIVGGGITGSLIAERNGITFSFMAAQIIGGLIEGSASKLIDDFALDRNGKASV
jgi:hypothetical protein